MSDTFVFILAMLKDKSGKKTERVIVQVCDELPHAG
jgi:hypothetical protein